MARPGAPSPEAYESPNDTTRVVRRIGAGWCGVPGSQSGFVMGHAACAAVGAMTASTPPARRTPARASKAHRCRSVLPSMVRSPSCRLAAEAADEMMAARGSAPTRGKHVTAAVARVRISVAPGWYWWALTIDLGTVFEGTVAAIAHIFGCVRPAYGRDQVVGTFVLSPGDIRRTRFVYDLVLTGCWSPMGWSPCVACERCGALVASRTDDCHVAQETRFYPSTVVRENTCSCRRARASRHHRRRKRGAERAQSASLRSHSRKLVRRSGRFFTMAIGPFCRRLHWSIAPHGQGTGS